MNLLTDDMLTAINNSGVSDKDKKIIEAILYQERQNKERSWDNDAEGYITKLIDVSQIIDESQKEGDVE